MEKLGGGEVVLSGQREESKQNVQKLGVSKGPQTLCCRELGCYLCCATRSSGY